MKWVLLPGFDGTGKLFTPLLRVLPPEVEPIVVSYPIDRRCSADELVEIARARLPTAEPFVLVAESFSGPIALKAAALHSKPPSALALCASFAVCPFRPCIIRMFKPIAAILNHLSPPSWAVRRYLLGNADEDSVALFYSAIGEVAPEVLTHRLSVLTEFGEDFTPRRQIPLLYLQAERDRLIAPVNFEVLQRKYPQARLRPINSPHLLLQIQPEAAAKAIFEFSLQH